MHTLWLGRFSHSLEERPGLSLEMVHSILTISVHHKPLTHVPQESEGASPTSPGPSLLYSAHTGLDMVDMKGQSSGLPLSLKTSSH